MNPFVIPKTMEQTMAGVDFPPGIDHAIAEVSFTPPSHPAGPPGVPIPYPNTAHFENPPAGPLLDALFDIDVLGIAPQTEFFGG